MGLSRSPGTQARGLKTPLTYVQASQDLGVHAPQLRDWVKAFADDPQYAFPGQGQMKPEQLEIMRLKSSTKLFADGSRKR